MSVQTYKQAVVIDISSTNHTLTNPASALLVGVAGDVKLIMPVKSASARVTLNSSGVITAITLEYSGAGYDTAPTVVVNTASGGSGANITCTVANGVVTGFTIVSGGTGYSLTNPPAIKFTSNNAGQVLKLPAGIHPISVKTVVKTGTAATDLVALYD